MKILKPQTPVKTYRQKMVDKFIDKWFPVKPITIPTTIEVRNAILKKGNNDGNRGKH